VPLAGYEASGTAGIAAGMYQLWPADLGTAAPGVDFIAMGREPASDTQTLHLVLMQQDAQQLPRAVHVPAAALPNDPSGYGGPVTCGQLPIGVGKPEVVALCGHRSSEWVQAVDVWHGTVLHPDAAPGSGTPPALPSWTQLTPDSTPPASPWPAAGTFSSDIHGFVQAGSIPAGWTGLAEGTAVFLMNADQLYVVEIGADLKPRAYALAPALAGFIPDTAMLGRLDATSWFHLVVAGQGTTSSNGGTLVLKRDASGYSVTQRLGASAYPAIVAPLAAGSPGDLVAGSARGWGGFDVLVLGFVGSGTLQ
jgi:hypothetical protein